MARITHQSGDEITLEVTVKLSGSLLESESGIQDACNEVGSLATQKAIERFDTDGSSLMQGALKWTSKGQVEQKYQTPYGAVKIARHVYQTAQGGRTWCPLEDRARMIRKSTPRFAKQLSHKYSQNNASAVCRDLAENHNRSVVKSFVQDLVDWVGGIASAKEESWQYKLPNLDEEVASVSLSMDGAHILLKDEGWREAMVGTISLYSSHGDRLHTTYIGESPEYGKGVFKERFEREITRIKALYPNARYLGIADGAVDFWSFLRPRTQKQLLDFYHVTEYLSKVAFAAHPDKTGKPARKKWLNDRCHQLKHEPGYVEVLIEEMEKLARKKKLTKSVREDLSAAQTYIKNHRQMMDYAQALKDQLPIGSGVTEAACKTLVKQRLCASGMRWKSQGAKIILTLRGLVQSGHRWQQFWGYIDQYGVPSLG